MIPIVGFLIQFTVAKNITVYPKLGFLTESTDDIILVNGLASGDISLRLNLPKLNIENNDDTCAASKSNNFSAILSESVSKFRAEMAIELGDILGQDLIDKDNNFRKLGPTVIDRDSIMQNPLICNEKGVKCSWFPLVENDPISSKHHTIIPCYDSSLGTLAKNCQSDGGVNMCCSKIASKNDGVCPNDLTRAIKAIDIFLSDFPEKKYEMGHANVTLKNVHNFCFSLLSAYYNRKELFKGSHNRGSVDRFLPRRQRDVGVDFHAGDEKFEIRDVGDRLDSDSEIDAVDFDNSNHVDDRSDVGDGVDVVNNLNNNSLSLDNRTSRIENNRKKRSNWSYLTSGWIFSSKYIDENVQTVIDLEKTDNVALKNALNMNSKTLLKIEGDLEEKKKLESNICSVVGELSEEIFLNHLRNSQFLLENKAENILRTCTNGRVPDYIGIHHLQKMCSAVSDSSTCSNSNLRDLFQCSVSRPQITLDFVGVNMKLVFRIPVSETYESFRIYTTGVPFKSHLDSQFNITEDQKVDRSESVQNVNNNDQVKKALAEIFSDAVNKNRDKRELANTYHFLALRHIPNVLIKHDSDLLLFYKTECYNIGRDGDLACDYSSVSTQHTKCLEGILSENLSKIQNYCSISLFSSTSDCITKPVGNLGYLISSHSEVPITNSKSNKVFRNKNNLHYCRSVCFIGLDGSQKYFTCGDRDFSLRNENPIEINLISVPIKQIDLSSLKARHHDLKDLELSGFDKLDNSLNKKTFTRVKTISTVFSTLSIILIIVLIIFVTIRKIRNLCYSLCIKCCFKSFKNRAEYGDWAETKRGMDYKPSSSY